MAILKDLEKNKKERLDSSIEFVAECKLLLDSNQSEEREVLRAIGMDAQLQEVDKNLEMQILNKKYEDEYQGTIFHISELKKMCLKYRLFIRPSNKYRGSIPPDLGSIVNRLVKEKKVVIGKSADYNSFYVMAPPKMFKGYKSEIDKFIEVNKVAVEMKNNFIRSLQDPLLLYKIDEEHFLFLKKWGNDLNFIRTIPAFFLRTKARVVTVLAALLVLALSLPLYLGNSDRFIPTGKLWLGGFMTGWGFGFGILSLAFMIYSIMMFCAWCNSKHSDNTDTEENYYAGS